MDNENEKNMAEAPTQIDAAAAFREAADSGGPSKFTEPWTPPSVEELDSQLPAFKVEAVLGKGGMGAVYRAHQLSLERTVAIKILPPEIAQDTSFALRFEREAKALAQLNHPNIVQIYDFGKTEQGHYFFVMEFVDGADFHQVISSGEMDSVKALGAISQICSALEYAHEQGYVHRDIKPANIFVNKKGILKVGDFGLAKITASIDKVDSEHLTLTQAGTGMGTPGYSAPEQIEGKQVDHRVDIYSLGVMFYLMLTGDLPRGRFSAPSEKVGTDDRLDSIVFKAMEAEPDRRYTAVSEMITDINIVQTAHAPRLERTSESEPVKPKRLSIYVAIAGLLALCAATAAGWKMTHPSTKTITQIPKPLTVITPLLESHGPHQFNCWRGKNTEFRHVESNFSNETITELIWNYDRIFEDFRSLTGCRIGGKKSELVVFEAPPGLKDGLYAPLDPLGNVHMSKTTLAREISRFENSGEVDFWFLNLAHERFVKQLTPRLGFFASNGKNDSSIIKRFLSDLQLLRLEHLDIQTKAGTSLEERRKQAKKAASAYAAAKEIDWLTLVEAKTVSSDHGKISAQDVFAAILFELHDRHGDGFVRRFFVEELPKAPVSYSNKHTTENFYQCATRAASKDLSDLFVKRLRWPVQNNE